MCRWWEASGGKTGSLLQSILLLTCMQYDGKNGYAVSAIRIMRTGGILTLCAVGILFLNLRRRRGRQGATGKEA